LLYLAIAVPPHSLFSTTLHSIEGYDNYYDTGGAPAM
ncbi:hypothetical protein J2T13_005288, partial [Paenibacillus sp. DS2015]